MMTDVRTSVVRSYRLNWMAFPIQGSRPLKRSCWGTDQPGSLDWFRCSGSCDAVAVDDDGDGDDG